MSRVGKEPIPIPEKTSVDFKDNIVTIKGEKGTLARNINSVVNLNIDKGYISVDIVVKGKNSSALQGLTRSLVANMVTGVSRGFERGLIINGIGYRAAVKGNIIVFNLGYSHPIDFVLPEGISAIVDKNSIKLSGIDNELLGTTAASIRRLRPPEPYKGKGIKYTEEHIQRKAGKAGATG